ncbi:MAG: DNA-binding NarL/FixJ family response regulator [Flammeovirgaceae bacterium]|jgi:DNA-binding NarL/FixJ family response regulator
MSHSTSSQFAKIQAMDNFTPTKIRIAIAEDQPKLLHTLLEALGIFEEVEVSITATNGKELIRKLQQAITLPTVILMDIEMPVMDGILATEAISNQFPEIKIIMLTVFDGTEKIFQSIVAGASGYLLKGDRTHKIVQAVIDAKEGRLPMSPSIASKYLQLMRSIPASEKAPQDFGLTKREVEILEYISQAYSCQKIHVSSKAEAVQLVMKNHASEGFSAFLKQF